MPRLLKKSCCLLKCDNNCVERLVVRYFVERVHFVGSENFNHVGLVESCDCCGCSPQSALGAFHVLQYGLLQSDFPDVAGVIPLLCF